MLLIGATGVAALVLATGGRPAWGTTKGVVVRLQASGGELAPGTSVMLNLQGASEKLEVPLLDDGQRPDVAAGDGTYSGGSGLFEDAYTGTLTVAGKSYELPAVSFDPEQGSRDLDLMLNAGKVELVARGAGPGPSGTTTEATPTEPAVAPTPQLTGPADGQSPTPVVQPAVVPSATVESGGDGVIWILGGLGLLALVGLGWMWMRPAGRGGEELPDPLPEPGVLGPKTPSLSEGVSTWVAPEAELLELTQELLATLARHHRVVLVGDLELAPVFGGPVYRAPKTTPEAVGDLVEDLDEAGGAPVVILVVGAFARDEAASRYAAELSPGQGGIVVIGEGSSNPPGAVLCQRVIAGSARGWRLQHDRGITEVRPGPWGLEPATSP
jgi:hypothetical protein